MARVAHGGAYIARGRAFMRITTAPGVRTPKALPWVTPEQIASHDGAAGAPCACVACLRARATQALVNRLRDAGQDEHIDQVVTRAAAADSIVFPQVARDAERLAAPRRVRGRDEDERLYIRWLEERIEQLETELNPEPERGIL